MKHLLVIGAGTNQMPVIKAAKELGCYVYVVTTPGDYPGIQLADEWINKSIFDTDEIAALFADGKKPIDGVISDLSDMAAPLVGEIAEKLGLPTWGHRNAMYFTDKVMMRELFEKIGLPVPSNRKVGSPEDAAAAAEEIGYPVVVKPTNSFSSRGITLVQNGEDMADAYQLAYDSSRTHEVVVEKYISGKQYFSQGFVSDYQMNMYAFSDRYYYNLPDVFIPYTNAFPALIDKSLEQRMVADFQRIIDELKPRFGHVWAEWIVDDRTGELYIVEIAIRGGGAHVTTDLLPLTYGVDTTPLLVREALGENTGFAGFTDFTRKAAAFYSFLLPEGEIVSVSGVEDILSVPGVVSADIKPMKPGDKTEKIMDKGSRYGLIVIRGEDRDELDRIWNQLKETVKVSVKTADGIRGIIWE